MSSPTGKRDVIRLRTFAEDVARAQETKGVGAKAAADALINEAPQKSQAIFHKVEKKALTIKDTAGQATALDSDGIQFEEEVATKVTDQAYEEHKTVTDDAKQKAPAVEIHQTDSLDVIAQKTPAPKIIATAAPSQPHIAQKVATTFDQIQAPVASIQEQTDAHAVHEMTKGDLGAGEIVSDKKRDRFKLFPAIIEATNSWFSETKEQLAETQREKHTVAKTETRAETIKAAAQEKTLAPDEDFDEVALRLKNQKRTAASETPVMVKPKPEAEARWTHMVGDNSEIAAATSSEPTVAEPVVAEVPTPAAEPITPPTTIEPSTPVPVTAPEPPPVIAAPIVPPAPTPVSSFSLPSLPTLPVVSGERLPSPLLAIAVVIVAVAAGIGTSLYFFWQPNDAVVPVATTNPLFTAELQTNVNLLASHSETMQSLLDTVTSNSGTLYFYLTQPTDGAIIPPHETMAFLAPQAPGNFARSVTNVSFGSLGNQPFIVLRVNNFDNAFSGMLAWEQTMSADLSPLFGPVVTESFDPQARTDTQTRGAFFRDVVASNLSGRLLANERGEDRILYTFVDRQTIIIAVDRLQLNNILPLIR